MFGLVVAMLDFEKNISPAKRSNFSTSYSFSKVAETFDAQLYYS